LVIWNANRIDRIQRRKRAAHLAAGEVAVKTASSWDRFDSSEA
jgi:hypothetical protein